MSNAVEGAKRPSGPPWIRPEIQQKISWRDGDIVISVPPKSGTTWTMNIVHQLLTGGSADFRDIYQEVPWIEFVAYPGEPHADILQRLDALPTGTRRAFKSHSAPPVLPFIKTGTGPGVKYIVVFRNPEEALVSFQPFLEQHSDEWFDLWQMPRGAMCRPDFASFYSDIVDSHGMQGAFFGFLKAWWPLRRETNVLFMHYADMKRNHRGSIEKIAKFLGITPTAGQWPAILEHTSFPWMKQHEDKFEADTAGKVRILRPGAMMRKGEAGKARSEGMTEEISRHLRDVGSRVCPDETAVNWFYQGGALP